MQRSGSQKFLLVISIIDIVVGAFALIGAILLIMGGGMVAADPTVLADSGLTADEAGIASGAFSFLGLVSLFTGAIGLLEGILGIRAANDNQKIMPVWVLSLIGLIGSVVGVVMSIANGSIGAQAVNLIAMLAGSALMFWVANNIKRQAGK